MAEVGLPPLRSSGNGALAKAEVQASGVGGVSLAPFEVSSALVVLVALGTWRQDGKSSAEGVAGALLLLRVLLLPPWRWCQQSSRHRS